jgi:hypothetical protein
MKPPEAEASPDTPTGPPSCGKSLTRSERNKATRDGVLLIESGGSSVGIELQPDATKLRLLGAKKWFEEQRDATSDAPRSVRDDGTSRSGNAAPSAFYEISRVRPAGRWSVCDSVMIPTASDGPTPKTIEFLPPVSAKKVGVDYGYRIPTLELRNVRTADRHGCPSGWGREVRQLCGLGGHARSAARGTGSSPLDDERPGVQGENDDGSVPND